MFPLEHGGPIWKAVRKLNLMFQVFYLIAHLKFEGSGISVSTLMMLRLVLNSMVTFLALVSLILLTLVQGLKTKRLAKRWVQASAISCVMDQTIILLSFSQSEFLMNWVVDRGGKMSRLIKLRGKLAVCER